MTAGVNDDVHSVWAVLQTDNKGLEHMHFEHNPEQYFFLQRFDLGKVYEYQKDHKSNNTCVDRSVTGAMPKVWAFLQNAKYVGEHTFKKRKYDLWREDFGKGKQIDLAVQVGHEDRPGILYRRDHNSELIYEFFAFKHIDKFHNASIFDVPKICP